MMHSNEEIVDLFVDMFFNLYNYVSYNNAYMEVLKKNIDMMRNVHRQFIAPRVLLVVT